MKLTINKEFKALIPPLSDAEYKALESSILADCCRDALVVWDQGMDAMGRHKLLTLVDGHNRYAICQKYNVPFRVHEIAFVDAREARMWIRNNQMSRRNLNDAQRIELMLANKDEMLATGKAKRTQTLRKGKETPVLSSVDKTEPHHNTRTGIAQSANVATGTVAKAEVVRKAAPDKWQECTDGKKTIHRAYTEVKRAEDKHRLEVVAAKEAVAPTGEYDVIVVDPPWPIQKIERDVRPNQTKPLDYPTLTVEQIRGLSLPMAEDCHVWLWTTQKYLPEAFQVLQAWGLRYVCTFCWHKPGGFQPVGLPQYNCEFVLYGRRGTPQFLDTKAFPTCFTGERGKHSEKPDAFYEMIRRVTGGRRLDMFSRRKITGFTGWGNEA